MILSLEKMLRIEYNFSVVDSLQVSSKSTRPPGTSDPEFGLRARSPGARTWRNMSLRHVSLRETGWSRNPTSSGFAQRNRNQRVRRRNGKFRKYAFLASQKRVLSADACSDWLGVRSAPQVCVGPCNTRRCHGAQTKYDHH